MKPKKAACSVPFGKFQNAVVWGVKGKILCPAGCQNRRSRITKAKEILKNLLSAGSWRPLKCIFSEKGKRPSTAGRKPRPVRSMYAKTRQGQSAAVLEQVSTTVPKSAILRFLSLAGNLLGSAFPKPCYGGLRRKNISDRRKVFSHFRPENG